RLRPKTPRTYARPFPLITCYFPIPARQAWERRRKEPLQTSSRRLVECCPRSHILPGAHENFRGVRDARATVSARYLFLDFSVSQSPQVGSDRRLSRNQSRRPVPVAGRSRLAGIARVDRSRKQNHVRLPEQH